MAGPIETLADELDAPTTPPVEGVRCPTCSSPAVFARVSDGPGAMICKACGSTWLELDHLGPVELPIEHLAVELDLEHLTEQQLLVVIATELLAMRAELAGLGAGLAALGQGGIAGLLGFGKRT